MDRIATLLYVDDEIINLKLFEINFRGKFSVITALSGFEGLEKLRENPSVSAVISDMKMPGMNGMEFIRKARELHPGMAFFILSGYDITDDIREALNARLIHSYFRKPFNIAEIESSVMAALG